MVVIPPAELGRLSQEVRFRILQYVLAKGVRPRDLGVSSSLLLKIKHGYRSVSDSLLMVAAQYLSPDELRAIMGEPEAVVLRSGGLDRLTQAEKAFIAKTVVQDPELRALIRSYMKDLDQENTDESHTYTVTKRQLQEFVKVLKSRKVSKSTMQDRVRYLMVALSDLNHTLSPSRVRDYITELSDESPTLASHIAKALKIFIKHVLHDRVLYDSFTTPHPQEPLWRDDVPTIKEVRKIAEEIGFTPAKAYFTLLAETGLRPGEILNARLSWLDLDEAMLVPAKDSSLALRGSKRSYIAMFSWRLRDFLRDEYLPRRLKDLRLSESRVTNLGMDPTKVRGKLFPYKPNHLRQEIYEAMDKALGKRLQLYSLRHFFTTYMISRNIPPLYINIWQGRVPPKQFKIMQQHYMGVWIDDLRRKYDESKLCILCENP